MMFIQGLAFAPVVSDMLGQLGPDCGFFALYGALLTLLPATCSRSSFTISLRLRLRVTAGQLSKDCRGSLTGIYVKASYRIVAAVLEDVTEQIYGNTFALRNLPADQQSSAWLSDLNLRCHLLTPTFRWILMLPLCPLRLPIHILLSSY